VTFVSALTFLLSIFHLFSGVCFLFLQFRACSIIPYDGAPNIERRCARRPDIDDIDDDALESSEYYRDPQFSEPFESENQTVIQLMFLVKVPANKTKPWNCYRWC